MTTAHEVRAYPFSEPDRLTLDPTYARLRTQEPLSRVQFPLGEPAWLATRYHDVRTVLADPRFSRALAKTRDQPRTHPDEHLDDGLVGMDAPDHARLRKLVARAFTGRRVELMRADTERIVEGLADTMVEQGGPFEMVENFAIPVPVTVISEMLGVPAADRPQLRGWSEAMVSTTALPWEEMERNAKELFAYIGTLVAERRRNPTEDLLGALVKTRDEDGDRLSEEELVMHVTGGLLITGTETTASQIPNFLYALLSHRDQWELLCAHPELVPRAVEELVRWIPLNYSAMFARYALEDVQFGDVTVKAGEPVLGSVASANRDPEIFEDPDRLDLTREHNPHIGFGHGPHHCLGAQLARMELQSVLSTLITRFPTLDFADGEDGVIWKQGMLVRGPKKLRVVW
ncbi:cytochrome P450 [Streptomyces sioyaensis]|uniref:Cytochrome P450 n=1 Tax=Streptomyces sioyaensis TaxID=67364 RepID=A0A4V1NNT0_9ACTN|nr:cytochrome P450 [Streptomyces sioyaensis]MBM4796764.1 cytochrome P450 [Streptomyces sioyaensis]RXS59310.1 cytochrome P450 [Streptomyces sioyaensis]